MAHLTCRKIKAYTAIFFSFSFVAVKIIHTGKLWSFFDANIQCVINLASQISMCSVNDKSSLNSLRCSIYSNLDEFTLLLFYGKHGFSVFLCKEKPFSQFPIQKLRFAINIAKTRVRHYISDSEYKKFPPWDLSLSFTLCLSTSKLIRIILWNISSPRGVLIIFFFNMHPCILTLLSEQNQ